MIDCELLRDKGILLIAPEGPLAPSDFQKVAALADPYIAEKGVLKGLDDPRLFVSRLGQLRRPARAHEVRP
jgi:hypothetical protein